MDLYLIYIILVKLISLEKIYKISKSLQDKKIPILPRALMIMIRVLFSCDISYSADIHPTVLFNYNGLGTVIHSKSKIGKDSLIIQHVTLGGNMGAKEITRVKFIVSNHR